jgi:hypothetical protein
MSENPHIIEHPTIRQLRKRIHECREDLLGLLDEWHYLKNVVQPRIMFVYENIFGDIEQDIQIRTRLASEIERRVELLSLKLRRGEKLNDKTIRFINTVVQKEFERYNGIRSSNNGFSEHRPSRNGSSNHNGSNNRTFFEIEKEKWENNYEAPHLYRKLVKKLHPDVSGETEIFKKYWENVQDAYQSSNMQRLKLFWKTLCSVDERRYQDPQTEEAALRAEIRDLEINIEAEKRKIERLKNQEPFVFEDKLSDRDWVRRRLHRLKEKVFQLDRQINFQRRMLRTLAGRHVQDEELRKQLFGLNVNEKYFEPFNTNS